MNSIHRIFYNKQHNYSSDKKIQSNKQRKCCRFNISKASIQVSKIIFFFIRKKHELIQTIATIILF